MSEEEVSIDDPGSDDYEVVPMGPVRKLERRLESVEKKAQQGGGADQEMVRDVLDIMKSNQKIVNDMTESTHELKNSVEDLTHKMDVVVDNMNEFMDLLKDASEVDMEGELVGDMQSRLGDAIADRMDEAMAEIESSNQEIVDSLDQLNSTMRRMQSSQSGAGFSGRSSGVQANQSGGGSMSQRNSGNRQSGGQMHTSGSSGGSDSERMRKLRNRLNKDNEEQ